MPRDDYENGDRQPMEDDRTIREKVVTQTGPEWLGFRREIDVPKWTIDTEGDR